jgi:sialate O-acetylesterase
VSLMNNPATFMTGATDLATGVHPANKSGYGTRDSLVALGAVYKKKVEYYGPLYQASKVDGDKLRLSFTHTGKGLTVPAGQKLQGFSIAGEDKKFYWADAAIDGDTVVLSSASVPKPVAARYAWNWDIRWANLFNKDGLPAIMFRTDAW